MLLADARLPVGGHTQSGNLEPALRSGLQLSQVPEYLRARLDSVVRVEAATAVVARHRCRHGAALVDVERAWAARTPSAALRSTSRQLGRGMLRLARQLWSDSPALHGLDALAQPPRAVVLGAVAAAAGLSAASLARLIAYDDLQTVAAAALKLEPLDPALTTRWVFDLMPRLDQVAQGVAAFTRPDEIPALGAPQIEVWAEHHTRADRRLFSA